MNPQIDDLSIEAVLGLIAAFGFFFLVLIAATVVIGHFIGKAAARKNRSYGAFFALSILLSPLITGLVVAALPFDESDPKHPKNKS